MKKIYIQPSMKAYAVKTSHLMDVSTNNVLGNGTQLSKRQGDDPDADWDDWAD